MWPTHEKTEALLAEIRAGDEDAVNRLMERHRRAVARMIELRLDQRIRQRVDSSDIVQDVLIEANRRLPEYLRNPAMPFHLWLRHIARDRIVDAHRRHRVSAKRSVDRERALAPPPAADHSTLQFAIQLCDREMTPATAAAQRELARQVEAAIADLDDPDCEILVMRHYEQLSNQEVAQALGLSEPAASMRYLRAIRRLRAALGASPDGLPKDQA